MHQMVSHGDDVHRGGGRRAHILFFPHSSIVAAPHGSLPLSLLEDSIPSVCIFTRRLCSRLRSRHQKCRRNNTIRSSHPVRWCYSSQQIRRRPRGSFYRQRGFHQVWECVCVRKWHNDILESATVVEKPCRQFWECLCQQILAMQQCWQLFKRWLGNMKLVLVRELKDPWYTSVSSCKTNSEHILRIYIILLQ